MKVSIAEVGSIVNVNDTLELVYPSSKDGSPQLRGGRVEKLLPNGILMEVREGGFRTFNHNRIVGGTVTLLK